jgi:trehalose 6-phosphate synthase/phosphatase
LTPHLSALAHPKITAEEASGWVRDSLLDDDDDEALRSHDAHRSSSSTDNEWPKGSAISSQPEFYASSRPAALFVNQAKVFAKARELDCQHVAKPRARASGGHDDVFKDASWDIVNADQSNSALYDAADDVKGEIGHEGYTWVGTLGLSMRILDKTQQKQDIEDKLSTQHDMLTIFCSDKDFEGHYSHFCKKILWPVFHYQLPDNLKSKAYEDHSWKFYVSVNQAFADRIVKNWKRGDTIWIHDYHLLLVPGMIREKLPQAKVGLFLHVPFPSSEVFRCLAVRKELLEGMLGANLIGFQIDEYKRHFLQTCSRVLNIETATDGVQLDGRLVNVVCGAIGIDPDKLNVRRQDPEVAQWVNILKERYRDKKIIVTRDKLDHVRGVRQKLLSYELFLNKYPNWRNEVVFIHITPPTSGKTGLDAVVGDIVTRINASHGTLASQPLVYLKQDIPYSQYLAILTIADALFITSLGDGMNLMPHEFIMCQDGKYHDKEHGSLILSEFTGASALFGRDELTINPWSYQLCSEAIKKALELPQNTKASCWERLHKVVNYHTGGRWFTKFLQHLDLVYEEQHRHDQKSVPRLNVQKLRGKYESSNRRLFFLGFEGTLIPNAGMNSVTPISLQVRLSLWSNHQYTLTLYSGH